MAPRSIGAAILVTGDEVLGGRVGERNAGFLARSLAEAGIPVLRTVVVGDDPATVQHAVSELLAMDVALICTTGGLGPTADDLTMAAVAAATGRTLRMDENALAMVHARSRLPRSFAIDDDRLELMRRKQASLPDGALVLPPAGTAPGAMLDHEGTLVVVLPGPPWELERMWAHAMLQNPLAALLAAAPGPRTRTFRLWSVIEAELVEALDQLDETDVARIGTYTRDGELEIVAPADLAAPVHQVLVDRFPDLLFATDGETVDVMVATELRRRGEVLAVAESCTGGGLGGRLTAQPGSSGWFLGGVIAYADSVKTDLLGVSPDVIARHGAVSAECAEAMAVGVRAATGADWGVSITGIAGPDGATAEKPVGTVWIGVAGPDGSESASTHLYRGDRESVRKRAQTGALHRLRIALTRTWDLDTA